MGPANDTSNTGRLWTWFTRHAKWVHQDVDKELSHHYYWSGNARFHSLFRRCAKNGQTGSLPDKLNSTQRIRDPRCCGVGKGHISGVGKSLVNRKGQVRLGDSVEVIHENTPNQWWHFCCLSSRCQSEFVSPSRGALVRELPEQMRPAGDQQQGNKTWRAKSRRVCLSVPRL